MQPSKGVFMTSIGTKIGIAAIAAVSSFALAAPALAVVTTFASFNAIGNGNVVYKNNGTGGSNSTFRSNGTGGTIGTTSSAFGVRPADAVFGGTAVTFSFLQSALGSVSNVDATFTLLATAAPSPTDVMFGFSFMSEFTGSFSFISTAPISVGPFNFAAGRNLLSGTFSEASIVGQTLGSSGSLSASTPGGFITYTSDFLDFSNTVDRDFSMSLTAITSLVSNVNRGLNSATGANSLRSFRATSTGSFSSDPAPLTIVPEPQTWALLVLGFGMVGVTLRRRKTLGVVAA
jgi:hypothetical protein